MAQYFCNFLNSYIPLQIYPFLINISFTGCIEHDKYLGGYAGGRKIEIPGGNLAEAKLKCLRMSDCQGITKEFDINKWTLRKSNELKKSTNRESSMLKSCFIEGTLILML